MLCVASLVVINCRKGDRGQGHRESVLFFNQVRKNILAFALPFFKCWKCFVSRLVRHRIVGEAGSIPARRRRSKQSSV